MLKVGSPLGLLLSGLISLLIAVLSWELAAETVPNHLLPSLTMVLAALNKLHAGGQLQLHVTATLLAVVRAYLLAAMVGVIAGAALGLVRVLRFVVGPVLSALEGSPLVALAPLTTLWFGIGGDASVALGFVVAVFPIVQRVAAGLAATPQPASKPATFGASPAAPPASERAAAIVAGLRYGVVPCVSGVIVAEMIASKAGLGFLTLNAILQFDTVNALAAVLIICVPCSAVVLILRRVEAAMTRA